MLKPLPAQGRQRVVISSIEPVIDAGRFPVKRIVGETVQISADVFTDGHDSVSAAVLYRHRHSADWSEVPMTFKDNDRWTAEFVVSLVGEYEFRVTAWIDHFLTWYRDFQKRVGAGQDVSTDLLIGAKFVSAALKHSADDESADREQLHLWEQRLRSADAAAHIDRIVSDPEILHLVQKLGPRKFVTEADFDGHVTVDRKRAQFSAWYEVFPRSTSSEINKHGTLADVARRVPAIREMGFDILYLPPIHPVGRTFRKGPNNAATAAPGDVGSPWAIGATEGGHKAIAPELGTVADFKKLITVVRDQGMELAMDIAFQCSPDHPYVKSHPQWFLHRPDGTIQYAENPPKKYQDIYPFNFESDDWQSLWAELRDVFRYWIQLGVRTFRVDNPHTKPFPFWEWCIGSLKAEYPDLVFLAEAFTRPRIMERLAKLGFTQSYTYFTWRNTTQDLTEYLTELTQTNLAEYFRPNFWPNTPDILNEYLQQGVRSAFVARLVLAATMTASYGIYGPAFELQWSTPREPGSEEYLNSEKYQIRHHDLEQPDSLAPLIQRVNQIRQRFVCLHANENLVFHHVDNPNLIAYSKQTPDGRETILSIVNLDAHYTQSGWIELSPKLKNLPANGRLELHDLLSDAHYTWQGSRNYVELNPTICSAHVFSITPGS